MDPIRKDPSFKRQSTSGSPEHTLHTYPRSRPLQPSSNANGILNPWVGRSRARRGTAALPPRSAAPRPRAASAAPVYLSKSSTKSLKARGAPELAVFPKEKRTSKTGRAFVSLSLSLSLSLEKKNKNHEELAFWRSLSVFAGGSGDDERVLCHPLFFRETRSAFSGIFWETFAFQFKDTRLVPVKFTKGHLRRCLGLPKHRSQNSTEFHNTAQRCEQSARQRFVARARRGLRDDPFPFRPTRKREGDASLFTEEAPNEKNPPRRGQSQEFRRRVSITAQAAKAKTRPSAQALTSGAHRCSSRAQASTHSSSGAGGRDSSAACLRRHTVSISAAKFES